MTPASSRPWVQFKSFIQGGFECSTHRRRDGRRLDIIAATGHDTLARQDYLQLQQLGIATVRDGFRWHLIEHRPGHYDWSSVMPQIEAARDCGTQVIWDLLHYGWPDDIDIWSPHFVDRFAQFARASAKLIRQNTETIPFYCPVNEVSFMSWAAGDVGYLNPFGERRGFELKVQLARAAIAAMDEIWSVDQRARFVHCDPVIHIAADPDRPQDQVSAEDHRLAQYQAWDILGGTLWPQLGGSRRHLDIIGINYYPNNQWIHGGPPLTRSDDAYRALSSMLLEVSNRYQRPMLIAETGTEAEARPGWFRHICNEVKSAVDLGVPISGVCQYPILNHPGWDDERDCPNGLLEQSPGPSGRSVYWPLADELRLQGAAFGDGDTAAEESPRSTVRFASPLRVG